MKNIDMNRNKNDKIKFELTLVTFSRGISV